MTKFLLTIKNNIEKMKEYKTTTIFTIATTSKQEEKPYITPIRNTNDFVVSGCVIFNQTLLLEINRIIDGNVDIVLVDSEKKIPLMIHENIDDLSNDIYKLHNTIGFVETGNLSKICFNSIKKSKIFEYKPNDLTVNATWLFLSQRLNFLSGKKISILGAGNIGSKLALKLVECGSEVHIHRTNIYKGNTIAQGLNVIKPENTVSNIVYHENKLQTSFMSDVVIGATNGIQVITLDIIKSIKKDAIIVDLGKNTLTKEAITYAIENSIEIYRTDVTASLEGFIYEVLKMNNILKNSYGKKDLGYCTIVGGGYFGKDGDIVVDNIQTPSMIFGISNGDGSMKKELSEENNKHIKELKIRISNV
jgi:hypothetical protein